MANPIEVVRSRAVGFIDWLDASFGCLRLKLARPDDSEFIFARTDFVNVHFDALTD